MIDVLEHPAVRARVKPWSVEQYHRLGELGLLSERTELIRGAVIEKMSQSPLHGSIVERLRIYFERQVPENSHVRQEKPLTLADSEPEPDVAVVSGRRGDYLIVHPSTAQIVLEVSISSDVLDRLKMQTYAEAGIPECWLVFPETRTLERHTRPQGGHYREVERTTHPMTLASSVFSEIVLLPVGLFHD